MQDSATDMMFLLPAAVPMPAATLVRRSTQGRGARNTTPYLARAWHAGARGRCKPRRRNAACQGSPRPQPARWACQGACSQGGCSQGTCSQDRCDRCDRCACSAGKCSQGARSRGECSQGACSQQGACMQPGHSHAARAHAIPATLPRGWATQQPCPVGGSKPMQSAQEEAMLSRRQARWRRRWRRAPPATPRRRPIDAGTTATPQAGSAHSTGRRAWRRSPGNMALAGSTRPEQGPQSSAGGRASVVLSLLRLRRRRDGGRRSAGRVVGGLRQRALLRLRRVGRGGGAPLSWIRRGETKHPQGRRPSAR